MILLFRYVFRHAGFFWFGSVTAVLNKIVDLMPPLLVGWVIDSVSGNAPQWIRNLSGTDAPFVLAVVLSLLGVAIFAVESLFQWSYKYGFMTLAHKVQHDLRLDSYAKLQQREQAFFENQRLGNTLSTLTEDVNQLERFLYSGFMEILHLCVVLIFSVTVMFSTSWQLAIIGVFPVPLIIWGSLAYQKWIRPYYANMREAAGSLTNRLENNISGMTVIKSFVAETFELDRVAAESDGYQLANQKLIWRHALYTPLIRMLIAIGFSGSLLVGSYWILSGYDYLTVGELVLFSMLIQRMLWPLTRLGETLDDYERAGASANRIFALLDSDVQIKSPVDTIQLEGVRGELLFHDVQFSYLNEIPILTGLNMSVSAGETVGIAGTTGAGKSTIVKLCLRLYDPTGGGIQLDGVDIRELSLDQLRQSIALVSQDVYLFHGSIFENIAYGLTSVELDQVVEAAKKAELHEFVSHLPEKYNSIVGERGLKLSGGQRQRLSIARAILKDSPIMIFDEATSSVDTETERAIQANINQLTEGKTALIIAHRLSTIRHAHRIVVLDKGKVVEDGTHDQLLAAGNQYAGLWSIQVGEG